MPPQVPPTPVSSPSPNPQYDFILRDSQPPKRSFGLPGLPKPMLILVGIAGILFIIIVFAVILKGGKSSNTQQLTAVAGRAQEIARVSTLVEQESSDPNTQYLAATAHTALTSEQQQLTAYLATRRVKVSASQLAAYQDKTTDTQLNTAKQNNALESAYDSYLKNALTTYQTTLKAAATGASTSSLAILNDADSSSVVMLAAPQIATTQQ